MNLRTLKKQCEQAVNVLVNNYGYNRKEFARADDENFSAPALLDKRFVDRWGNIKPGVLPGTLVHWYRCSYEYAEYDCKLPIEILDEIRSAERFDWEALAAELRAEEKELAAYRETCTARAEKEGGR